MVTWQKKIVSITQCTDCSSAVVGNRDNLENTFLAFKDLGGLMYPSDDLIHICMELEITLRSYSSNELLTTLMKEKLQENIIQKFLNKQIFLELSINHDQIILEDHVTFLITKIVTQFYKLRMHHVCKSAIHTNNQSYIRTFYNKLILFKGQ